MKNKNFKLKILSACILSSLTSTQVLAQSQHYVPDSVVSNTVKNVVWGEEDPTPKPPMKYRNANQNDNLQKREVNISKPNPEHRKPAVVIHDETTAERVASKSNNPSNNLVIKKNSPVEDNQIKNEVEKNKKSVVKSIGKEKESTAYSTTIKKAQPEPVTQTVQTTKYVAPKSVFKADKGEKLSDALTRWAKKENWNLYWSSKSDFFLPTNIELQGGIEEVFVSVGEALKQEGISFDISLYRLNKTIVVK